MLSQPPRRRIDPVDMHCPARRFFSAAGLILLPAIAACAAGAEPAQTPAGSAVPKHPPRSVLQLEAALHAERTDRGLRVVLPADPLFDAEHTELGDAAAASLSPLAELVAAMHPREVIVMGHTDSAGDDDANLALSRGRAHAVASWLGAHLKHQPRIIEQGYGRTRPVAPNHNADGSDNPAGRASNRRIEILLRR